jgi:predicted chitinase
MPTEITDQNLRDIMPNLPAAKREIYLPFINEAMREFEISTYLRAAAFLAQLAHESAELRYFQELASGRDYDITVNPRKARALGNTQPGDGMKYKGHGPIQITGRANHEACGRALGLDLINNPMLITLPAHAFRSAAWFWDTRHLNTLADQRKFKEITRLINGGYNGLADRQKYYDRALRALPEDLDMSGGVVVNVTPDEEHGDVDPSDIAVGGAATSAADGGGGMGDAGGGTQQFSPATQQQLALQQQFAAPQQVPAPQGFDQQALAQQVLGQSQGGANSETQTTAVVQPTPDILSVVQAPRADASKSLWALIVGSPVVTAVAGAFKHYTQDNSLTKTVVICVTALILLFMLRQLILGFKREGHLGALINSRLGRR